MAEQAHERSHAGTLVVAIVTIGLPCYNVGATVLDTIRSILAQTVEDWELVVIDDGSTDDTVEQVQRVDDPRIRVITDGENRRLGARLNQIAKEATADVLVCMDGDDLMVPTRLEAQLAYLREHSAVDLLGGAMVAFGDQGPRTLRPAGPDSPSADRICKGDVLLHPTVAGRTDWFRKNPYDEAIVRCEDFDLWTRTAGEARIANLADVLVLYREFGTADYRKYCHDSRMTKAVLRRNGPTRVGRWRTSQMVAGRVVKDIAYGALHYTGNWNRALQLRGSILSDENSRHWSELMTQIRSVRLPGVD